jgi:YidC/Oxa1 family membrane protein insertase
MQKNLILAVVLSSLVYIGWYSFMEKKIQPQKPSAQAQAQQAQPQAAFPVQPAAAAYQAEPAALPENWKDKAVKITAGKAEYSFNPETASLSSVVYEGPVAPAELIPDPARGFFHASFPAKFALKAKTADSAEFVAQQGPIRFTKKFTFDPAKGINSLEIEAVNTASSPQYLPAWELRIGPGLNTVESEMKENKGELKASYTFSEAGRKHPTLKEVETDEPATRDWNWAGLNNRYFLAALVNPSFASTRPIRRDEIVGEEKKTPSLIIPMAGAELKPGEKRSWNSLFYLGPKDYSEMKRIGLGLDRSVDFGFFAPLAKLANSSLVYFRELTGNYGVAIIILSVIIQLLLTPLSFKSYKAMAVMKKIQPEMQAIQKRYKDDPKRMNAEVMDLYKRHGTNPLGGCLPMLLQIPVFFALFTALRNSWDLHGAPFIFWIKDLSSKDPFYVLPIVMGGIMFLQQHLSPQTSDPAQAAMMKWMPVIFTFMFLTFPSGLVLYWLINSTWGFAQTMYLQKKMG